LHGKTGLKKMEVPSKRLDDFDPLRKAVVFGKGTTKILVHESPEFRLSDTVYPSLREQKVELPVSAALFLLCKGAAEVTT